MTKKSVYENYLPYLKVINETYPETSFSKEQFLELVPQYRRVGILHHYIQQADNGKWSINKEGLKIIRRFA